MTRGTGTGSRRRIIGIVLFTPTTEREARNVLGYLDKQIKVLSGDLRPILLFDAANPQFRDLAIRRSEDAVWLAAWGAEMLRVHLHNIESNLDSRARRELILDATGGIPAETIKLVSAMQKADDPDEVQRRRAGAALPAGLAQGAFGDTV